MSQHKAKNSQLLFMLRYPWTVLPLSSPHSSYSESSCENRVEDCLKKIQFLFQQSIFFFQTQRFPFCVISLSFSLPPFSHCLSHLSFFLPWSFRNMICLNLYVSVQCWTFYDGKKINIHSLTQQKENISYIFKCGTIFWKYIMRDF